MKKLLILMFAFVFVTRCNFSAKIISTFLSKTKHRLLIKRASSFFFVFIVAISCMGQAHTNYVNPFIGTSNYGYTNPGAVMPWGMTSLSPMNTNNGEVTPSPYFYGKKYISGFSYLNMSGTGCPDMGTFSSMPTTGDLKIKLNDYWSAYSQEQSSPGYYSVMLDRYQVKAELTTTTRTGVCRYTFPKGQSNIVFNLENSLTKRKGGSVKIVSDTEIEGSKIIGGFCGMHTVQTVYFVAKISKSPTEKGVWTDDKVFSEYGREMVGNKIGAYFSYDTEDGEEILVKLGVSFVSIENARLNLDTEQPSFDFDLVRDASDKAWEKELSRIEVTGGTEDDKTIFYTALYHILLHPNVFNDVNGEYIEMEGDRICKTEGTDRYTIFSLWDTYRNVHPFLSLVYPEKQLDMVKSMVSMYNESGWLPKWELAGMETYVMVGDPALSVIADTYLRGIRDFDYERAYEAMVLNATAPEENNPIRPGLTNMLKYGYIPEGEEYTRWLWGTVSTGLEYCIADWNLAQMAQSLGKDYDYHTFLDRSMYYKNYFDTKINFMRPKLIDGSWCEPFYPEGKIDPTSIGFVEGNSWHYTFFVPHDIPGLIKLMGGEEQYIKKLDQCFEEGRFTMGNEPDMAYPYLFNYVKGSEWRTQKRVRETIKKYYNNSPGGIPGNDDCGTTSAYLLFSMMGFYPACPGDMDFQIGSPVFEKVVIKLNNDFYPGNEFVIRAKNAGRDNCFIQSMKLDGKAYKKYTINHYEIIKGGELFFNLKN